MISRALAKWLDVPHVVTARRSVGVVPGSVLELNAAAAKDGTGPGVNDPLTTTWTDLSGSGNQGTLTGFTGTPWVGTGTPSNPYRLASLGGGPHLVIPAVAVSCADYTFEACIGGISTWTEWDIFLQHGTSPDARWIAYEQGNPGTLYFAIGSTLSFVEPDCVPAGNLGFVSLVLDNTALTATVYVNGIARAPHAMSVPVFIPDGQSLHTASGSDPYDLAVARIYPFALTPEQVAQNYAAGLATVDTFRDQRLADYRPDAPGGDCFPERLPDTPDAAVMILSTGGNPTPAAATWGYNEPTVQLMVRGAPNDAVTPQARAVALYGALQGLRYTVLDEGGADEVSLIVCESAQTAPVNIGTDLKNRYRYVLNFALHVRALTAHRD